MLTTENLDVGPNGNQLGWDASNNALKLAGMKVAFASVSTNCWTKESENIPFLLYRNSFMVTDHQS
jgi:hypothetical protein